MKACPECGEVPIGRLKFMFKIDQRSAECDKCGMELTGDFFIYALWYFSILAGVVIGGGGVLLHFLYKWNISAIAFLIAAVFIFILIPIDLIVWQIGSYNDLDES